MFVVHRLASSILNPQKEDWTEMNRLERYKSTYPSMGVVFRRALSKEKLKFGTNLDCLTYYVDADLAGDKRDPKSTSGYCVHIWVSLVCLIGSPRNKRVFVSHHVSPKFTVARNAPAMPCGYGNL